MKDRHPSSPPGKSIFGQLDCLNEEPILKNNFFSTLRGIAPQCICEERARLRKAVYEDIAWCRDITFRESKDSTEKTYISIK